MASSDDEITRWLEGLAEGDNAAVGEVWGRYYERLVRLARQKLGEGHRREADEEDVALSAFHSLCRGAAEGRFPQLDNRHDLWKLLVTITARKAGAQLRRAHRHKRGGGAVRGESVFIQADASNRPFGIDDVMGDEPTPELVAAITEQCDRLLAALGDDLLRRIALAKLEGYSNEEIAAQLDCVPRTVERKLARIREIWGHDLPTA
jgi:DNA-directed RNA polymerase specialized sigma24 family protein